MTEQGDQVTPRPDTIRQSDRVTMRSESLHQDDTCRVLVIGTTIHRSSNVQLGTLVVSRGTTLPHVTESLKHRTSVTPMMTSSDETLQEVHQTRTHSTAVDDVVYSDKPKVATEGDIPVQVSRKTLVTHHVSSVTDQTADTDRVSHVTLDDTAVSVTASLQPLSPLPASPYHPRHLQKFPPDPLSSLSLQSVNNLTSHPYPVHQNALTTSQPPNSFASETLISKSSLGNLCLSQLPESHWEMNRENTLHPNTAPLTASQVQIASRRCDVVYRPC